MLKKIFKLIVLITILFFIVTCLQVLIYRFINPKNTSFMNIRQKQANKLSKNHKKYYIWKDSDFISANLKKAVIAAEDAKFYMHNGFDIDGIKNAFEKNQKKKKVKYGGSTITQQLAKNLYLWPERSYLRKGLEAYYTILLELFLSKNRILELYLNVIEWGNGIYGAEAASLFYYKISCNRLSQSQGATLAAIIPNPRRYKIYSNYIAKRREKLSRWANDVQLEKIEKTKEKEYNLPKPKKKQTQ